MSSEARDPRIVRLIDALPVAYQSLSPEAALLAVNEAWTGLLGYDRDEVLGRPIADFLTADSREALESAFPHLLAEGHAEGVIFQLKTASGDVRTVSVDARVDRGDSGEPLRTNCVLTDVTDAAERDFDAEVRVRITQAFLSHPGDEVFPKVLEIVLDALDSEYGVFGYVDSAGTLVAPSLTRDIWDRCQVSDKDATFPRDTWGDSLWARALIERRAFMDNEPSRVPEGHVPIERNMPVPILYAGDSIGLLHVGNKATDYTQRDMDRFVMVAKHVAPILEARLERDEAWRALRDSELRYRSVVEGAPTGMLIYDAGSGDDLVLTGMNPAAESMLAVDAAECVGRTLADLFPPLLKTVVPEEFRRVAREGGTFFDEQVAYADGRIRGVYEVSAFQSAPDTCAVAFTDVTERRKNDRELEAHREHLEELVAERTEEVVLANAAKSQFLANMSHELRTPLNSIIGFTGVILQGMAGPLTPEQDTQLTMVDRSAQHLLQLINEVLDLERIEAGGLDVNLAEEDLRALVAEVVTILTPAAEERGLDLGLDVGDSPDDYCVRTDGPRVTQILFNLVGNAIKFTAEGSVDILLSATDDEVRIAVRDTGTGIREEDLERVFDEFVQVAPDRGAPIPGTGLGLTVSRSVAHLLGGEIHVESALGEGSTFTLVLPSREEA